MRDGIISALGRRLASRRTPARQPCFAPSDTAAGRRSPGRMVRMFHKPEDLPAIVREFIQWCDERARFPDPGPQRQNPIKRADIPERFQVAASVCRDKGLLRNAGGDGYFLSAEGWLVADELRATNRSRTAGGSPDLLGDAVAGLLRRIPERWAEYEADVLTATEAQALVLLISAGMVERRGRFRLRMHNHPLAAEGTFAATGEYGFVEAMKYVSAAMWEDWKGAFEAWRAGETSAAPTFWCEHLKPDEWRLTDQGALARTHLDAGESDPLDFVLRRGFFDGQPRLIATEGRVAKRESVRGAGHLVALRKVRTDSISAASVNIANWKEGADAFAQALAASFKPSAGEGGPADAPAASPTAPTVDDESHFSPAKLAEVFGVPADALRTRLNRWRETHHDGWIENPERGPREPKYLYRVGSVRSIIEDLKATSETTSDRPAK